MSSPSPSGTPAFANAVAVISTISITLPKSYALARTRSSKFKTCLKTSKMSSPRRYNRSLQKMQRTVPLEVCTEEAGDEPYGANESAYACGHARNARGSRDAHDVGRSTVWPRKHGAYVGRDGNAARTAEYCRLLPFSCARHRHCGSAPPMWVRPPELRGCAACSR